MIVWLTDAIKVMTIDGPEYINVPFSSEDLVIRIYGENFNTKGEMLQDPLVKLPPKTVKKLKKLYQKRIHNIRRANVECMYSVKVLIDKEYKKCITM